MATNSLSKSRRSFLEPKKIANQYDMSLEQVYKLLNLPVFHDAVIKIGNRGKRVDQDKFYEILTQYYR